MSEPPEIILHPAGVEAAQPPHLRTSFTAAELRSMVFPAVAWVVEDLIAGGLSVLAGKPKLGKSWLLLDVAVAVARGGSVLGRKCVQGDVLYAALEDNSRRLQERMRKVVTGGDWPERLTIKLKMSRLDRGGLDELRDWIRTADNPRLIVIDVFSKVRRPKLPGENVYDADYLAVAPLKELADEKGVAIVVVHHLRKMQADADPLDAVSGSTGLTGAMDTVLVLNRGSDGNVTLYGRGRDIEEIEAAVAFDRQTCRWSFLGSASEVRRSEERRAIIDALRAEGEPMTPKQLADVTGAPGGNIRRLLLSMGKAGEVIKVKRAKYALPDITPPNIGNNGND